MRFLLLFVAALQVTAPPATVRGDRFQIAVPQGWKVLTADADVVLAHSSGASLLIVRVEATKNLPEYAEQQAERIMFPIGFAKRSAPKYYKDAQDEWVEYEIRGNRQADHRRILYRALRRGPAFYGVVYEAREDDFEALLTDAQSIASSVQNIIEAPPARRARSRAHK